MGFGLCNTGAICYLNSFLQVLAGCTALTKAVLQNPEYLRQTDTGAAVLRYFEAFATPDGRRADLDPELSRLSNEVLTALVADLSVRRPRVKFGHGQESALEAFVHILDMMEPPRRLSEAPSKEASSNPITQLFLHRFQCNLYCRVCKKGVSKETDHSVIFNLHHLDRIRPATDADFSKAVRIQVSETEGYMCPECQRTTSALRVYSLTMIPEIVFCSFNQYTQHRERYFPERLEFPSCSGGKLVFRLVGQIEHLGTLSGGHYWARGLRAGGRVCLLNDLGVVPSRFEPTSETYIVVYHYERHES